MSSERCFCPCHQYPGTYPPPCGVCGHDTREGRNVGGYRDGWEPNKVQDNAAEVARLTALLAERDAATVRLLDATAKMEEALFEIRDYCAELHDGDTLERLAYRVVGMANGAINDYYAALAGGEDNDGK